MHYVRTWCQCPLYCAVWPHIDGHLLVALCEDDGESEEEGGNCEEWELWLRKRRRGTVGREIRWAGWGGRWWLSSLEQITFQLPPKRRNAFELLQFGVCLSGSLFPTNLHPSPLFSHYQRMPQRVTVRITCDRSRWEDEQIIVIRFLPWCVIVFAAACLLPAKCKTNPLSVVASVLFDTTNKIELSSHRWIFQPCQRRHVFSL